MVDTRLSIVNGLEHRGMTMKSLSDAIHLRNQLIDLLEGTDFECAAGEIASK
jgi:hypothetical protein